MVAVVLATLVGLGWPAIRAAAQTPTPPAPSPPFRVKTISQGQDASPLVSLPTGLAPATVGAVYGLRTGLVSPTSAIGAGQVIAIIDAYHDPNALSDLDTFDAQYGYPALATCSGAPPFTASTGACFYQADPQGTPSTDSDWAVEESLDIEWAHAEAPGATIVLVEAASTASLMSAVSWANDNGATEVSMSWASGEYSTETSYDSYFDAKSTSTGAPIIYTAAAGDSGHGAVYPAASPNVIAVGGTTLNGCSGTSCADFSSETTWSDSGGGVSAYEKIPAYQSGYGGPVYSESSGGISALTGAMRGIPDVSFDADPNTGVSVYDSTGYAGQSGWFTVGGTSVGAPNWAGIFAAGADNATALQGAQDIYGGGYASYLRDITSGSNGICGTDCTAGTGYDLVTGLGSPINYPPPPPPSPTVTSVSPSSGPSTGGTAVTVTGAGFVAGSTTVDFGSTPATHVSVSSPEQLSATSPAGTTGEVYVTVTTLFGTSATGSPDQFFYTSTAASTSPQGNWVGTYGASGYALADWNGSSDTTNLPGDTLSLVEGSRYQWSSSTTDVRALESPDGSTREATCWYASSQLELQLSFGAAYSGNLELYALDWEPDSRSETISVNDGSLAIETAALTSFNDGAWMVFPITVASGGKVTITVQLTSGPNAVLSGIFLGGGADTAVSSATSPQGNWVGTYGASGYALADWNGSSDTTNLPGDALSLVEGSRYQWSSSTTDVRALESPDGSTREATCWYASSQLELQLSFGAAYSGNLELYALDWEPDSRSETISVNDGSLAIETAALTSFNDGAWMVFPITVASGGKVTITVQLTSGPNAVLSGIFLGGGADTAVSSATSPQGNWVGTYGASGYALADWNGSSDTTNLPGDALSLVEGSRYQWSSSTTDVRALESPDGSTREATCWYASSQLELQLSFGAAYSGNLELYALDWEPDSRSETISVNDGSLAIETAALTSFNDGAWMVFPITVASGGKVTITVQLTSGPNAVLSGIFLGGELTLQFPQPLRPRATGWAPTAPPATPWRTGTEARIRPISPATRSAWLRAAVTSGAHRPQTSVPSRAPTGRPARRPAGTRRRSWNCSSRSAPPTAGTSSSTPSNWEPDSRSETISVNDGSLAIETAALTSFNDGAWMVFPITVASGGKVTITVQLTSGPNAVLSGIFLGGA